MALSFTRDSVTRDNSATSTTVVSNALTFTTNDVIVVTCVADDNTGAGTLTISNSGSALSWNSIGVTNTSNNTKVIAWWALAPDSTSRTVTVTGNGAGITNCTRRLNCLVHTGANTTTPVPAGKVFSGVSGHNVSQAITPTATGSMLWMAAGDWAATNTFVAGTNCTLEDTATDPGQATFALVRPTTQPRTDALAFTLGETDTAGTIAWIAFEVQAAAASSGMPPSMYALGLGA